MRASNLLLLPLGMLLFSGCEKALDDMKDYFPVVRTMSATANADGSVTMTGEVTDEGDKPLEAAGFCVSTSPNPVMDENQAIAAVSNGRFNATYTGLDDGGTYYVRSWAINERGYSYGNILRVDGVTAQPVTPPCTPTLNTGDPGSSWPQYAFYYVGPVHQATGSGYEFTSNSSGMDMTIRFRNLPHGGIYTTTADPFPETATGVNVSFVVSSSYQVLPAGASVYVVQTAPTAWEITICQAPWVMFSSTSYFTARVACHT